MRRLCFLILAGCAPAPPDGPADLNDVVLKVLRSYPADGSCGYYWPKNSPWEGTTRDLFYRGQKVATGDPQRRSYCCGLTWEVFLIAHQELGHESIGALTVDDIHELRRRWFGDSTITRDRRRLVQDALVSLKLGRAVSSGEARPGDFVQFWRHNGSGHSAIFLEWVREDGRIVGLKYWSSQGSTKGIAENTERFGPPKGVKEDEVYLARAARNPPP
jgi:hypothetical protein